MTAGIRSLRPTQSVKRGLIIIRKVVFQDFDSGFERIFPECTEKDQCDILSAMEWLEQYLPEGDEEYG